MELGCATIQHLTVSTWKLSQPSLVHVFLSRFHLQTRLVKPVAISCELRLQPLLSLEVRAGNDAAKALYRKFGFTEDGVRPNYYSNGEDAILMSCTVD